MSVSDDFREYVLEQLIGVRGVTWRRMFGGIGLYAEAAFFGVIDDDQLFFRVDDATRPDYQARGAKPFAPIPGAKPMMGYFAVPSEVLEDREALGEWALGAVAVARSARKRPRAKARKGRTERKGRRVKKGNKHA